MLRHDISCGLLHRAWRFFIPIGIFLYCSAIIFNLIDFLDMPTFGVCWLSLFAGKPPIDFVNKILIIPQMWILIQLGCVILTIEYPVRELEQYGQQVIIKCGNRWRWWCSKCIWNFLAITFYFSIGICFVMIVCVFKDIPITLKIAPVDLEKIMFNSEEICQLYHNRSMVFHLFITPFVSMLALSFLQLLINLIVNQITALVVSIVMLVWAICYSSPLAIGNYSMLQRNSVFISSGLRYEFGFAISLAIIFAVIMIGGILFKRKNILLPKKNGE